MIAEYLESFIVVANSKSFADASQKLFISHTALIKRMNKLESRLGVSLFVRSTKGIQLTDAGTLFYGRAMELSTLSETYVDEVRQYAKKSHQTYLRVGYINDCRCSTFNTLSHLFVQEYPHIKLSFPESFSNTPKELLEDKLDIINELFGLTSNNSELSFLELGQETAKCFVAPNHPLANSKILSLSDIDGYSLALFPAHNRTPQKALVHLVISNCSTSDCITVSSSSPLGADLLFNERILVAYYENLRLSDFISIPLRCDLRTHYGILYRINPKPVVRKYIEVAQKLITSKNT